MLKKNNLLLIPIALVFSTLVLAEDCTVFETSYILDGKEIVQKEELCLFKEKQNELASSKNCTPIFAPTCPFHTLKKKKDFALYIKPVGTPGFNLCHDISGSPQIYKIKVNGLWKGYERCYSSDRKEFVDVDALIAFYRSL